MAFDITQLSDFASYAKHLLKIKTNMLGFDGRRDERIIPFVFTEPQQRLHLLWEQQLKTRGYVRFIILKARREGISTYVEGRLFHKVHTTPSTHAFMVAHDKDGCNTIFNMTKLFYEALPPKWKPMKRYASKGKELVFENPNEKTRYANPGLRSRIEVFTSNKESSSRSGGYSSAHLSEVAFYPDAGSLIGSTIPTIPANPGTILVYESTAFGRGGFFHEEWLKATSKKARKETNFIPVFFPWFEFKAYDTPFSDGCKRADILGTLDAEEKELIERYKVSPTQLHWRRHVILDLGNDLDLFHQENPATPEEAFIASGQCYFNREKLKGLDEKTVNPEFVGEVDERGLIDNPDGPLWLWKRPQKGKDYVLGVDVGGGGQDGNPSVIEVLEVPVGVPIVEQVAEWHGHVDPVILAGKAISLARFYNEGMLAPEINNHGLTCLNEIKSHYWNIYQWQYFDRYGAYSTKKLGWETNQSTRPLLCDYTSASLNADFLVIRSKALIDEMFSFIKRPYGVGGEADGGSWDDRVMAFMIALFCLGHSYQQSSLLKGMGMFAETKRAPRDEIVLRPEAMDLSMLDLGGERDYYKGELGWLNY